MKKIDQFVGCYSTSKTLRFKAIPVWETQDNLSAKRIIEEDETRAAEYILVKRFMDRIHKDFVERVLQNAKLQGLEEYIDLFCKTSKSEKDISELEKREMDLRKQLAKLFSDDMEYDKLLGEGMLKELLPSKLDNSQEKEIVSHFQGFYTAFKGFEDNRRNMYSAEPIATSICYRIINDNLPKFITNLSVFTKAKNTLGTDILKEIEGKMDLGEYTLDDLFCPGAYIFFLNQSGITKYNTIIGGYTTEDGTKVQGINEYINLHNQQVKDRSAKLPLLTPLYKQILSDSESISFYQEGFASDTELLDAIDCSLFNDESAIEKLVSKTIELFANENEYDAGGIYVLNGPAVTYISNALYSNWATIVTEWNKRYDSANMKKPPKDMEAYEDKRRKAYKAYKSFSVAELSNLGGESTIQESILGLYAEQVNGLAENIIHKLPEMKDIIDTQKTDGKQLIKNDVSIACIKSIFDSIKEMTNILKVFRGTQKEENRDEQFYGLLEECLAGLQDIDSLYDKIRNYVTQKPFTTNKFKLYFQNPQLLNGWDRNKERDYRTALLRKDNKYYLAIIDKSDSKALMNIEAEGDEDFYEKMNYRLLPSPSKMLPKVFFSKKGLLTFNPEPEVLNIYKKETFKKGEHFNQNDCWRLIEFYQKAINNHEEWSTSYGFVFRKPEEYQDISEFYHDVEKQGYSVNFDRVSLRKLQELVAAGKVYLFQLYNKDFSEHSHGVKNLHTLYFEMLFDPQNLEEGYFKLNGEAELFMRRASIRKEDLVIHPANQAVKNKNPLNPKKESVFLYDLIKDKRYSVDQYEFHVPITINRCPDKKMRINDEIRRLLAKDENPYVIGIDRGERNLLYICVIDGQGKIVEQFSLNEIINEHNGVVYRTDYHELLERREKERAEARVNWKNIETIKELKDGYISQVIHKICELVEKYDAVIAMEDLNSGFKNSRVKVEKQVYQKFEKALIDKLNYMADKRKDIYSVGGILQGYQLANPFVSFKTMGTQNGIIFYIPAWLTSKIDPTTGFVDLMKPKYTSVEAAIDFIKQFDNISFDEETGYFMFDLDYAKFAKGVTDFRKEWALYTNGNRIRVFRNPMKNNEWDWEEVDITAMMVNLCAEYKIDYKNGDLINAMSNISEKDFFVRLFGIIGLMLQMRNSITGRTDVDYLISPVKNSAGYFYDSRLAKGELPNDADANGAYNIARKVLWSIEQFKNADSESLPKTKIAISNKEWLEFAQTHTFC